MTPDNDQSGDAEGAARRGVPTLGDLLAQVAQAGTDPNRVTGGEIIEAVGARGFGPLIIVIAAIVVTPASAIPGLSSVCGLSIALIAAQYLVGKSSPWLPGFVLRASLDRSRLEKAIAAVQRPVRWVDRILKARLHWLTGKPFSLILIALCMALGAVMPLFEFVPMSSTLLASVVLMISLSLLTRDGLLALIGVTMLGLGAAGIMGIVRLF